MNNNESNSFDDVIEDAQASKEANANSQEVIEETTVAGTENADIEENADTRLVAPVDYKTKFTESAKEAQRLYARNQVLESEQRQTIAQSEQVRPTEQSVDSLYPGFENLDEEAQRNLIDYTNEITKRAKAELYKDPAIAFAKSSYNEKIWNDAFNNVAIKYPELLATKDAFKSKYYHVNNVPQNIESILEDVAKIHLFDQAKSIGAKEETEKLNRTNMERATSGDKTPRANRTLDDWSRMAINNPAKFAQHASEYQKDLESGKI